MKIIVCLLCILIVHSSVCGPTERLKDKAGTAKKRHDENSSLPKNLLSKPTKPVRKLEDTKSIALTMTRTTSVNTPRDPLALPVDVVDPYSDWDKINHEVVVRETGFYFFHLNAGAVAGQPVNLNLRGQPQNIDVYRGSDVHDGTDTIGRSFIGPVTAGTVLHLENEPNFQLYSDENRQTSFTAVDLTYFLDAYQQKIFCATRRTDWFSLGTVMYDEIVVNEGGDFDMATGSFIVKRSGFHVLMFSVGIKPGVNLRMQISTKYQGRLSEIFHSDTSHTAEDVLSKTIIADLVAGDAVFLDLISGEIHSDAERSTSFSGFFYKPREGHPIAWSLWSNRSHDASGAMLDPMPWDGALVNTNGVFNMATNQVHIYQHGIYYVELNIQAQGGRPVEAAVVQGVSRTEIGLSRSSVSHTSISGPLTNGLLLELNEEDTLKVILRQGTYSYSDGDRITTLSGYMVYPYPEAKGP